MQKKTIQNQPIQQTIHFLIIIICFVFCNSCQKEEDNNAFELPIPSTYIFNDYLNLDNIKAKELKNGELTSIDASTFDFDDENCIQESGHHTKIEFLLDNKIIVHNEIVIEGSYTIEGDWINLSITDGFDTLDLKLKMEGDALLLPGKIIKSITSGHVGSTHTSSTCGISATLNGDEFLPCELTDEYFLENDLNGEGDMVAYIEMDIEYVQEQ